MESEDKMSTALLFKENSSYQTPFDIMTDLDRAREEAEKVHQVLQATHVDNNARLWPSMASLKREILGPGGQRTTQMVGACLRKSWYHSTGVASTEKRSQRAADSAELGTIAERVYLERFRAVPGYRTIYPNINGDKLRYRRALTSCCQPEGAERFLRDSNLTGHSISAEVDLIIQHIETLTLLGIEMKTYDGAYAAIDLCGYEKAAEAYGSACPYVAKFLDKGRKVLNPKRLAKPFPKEDNLLQTMLYLDEFWKDQIHLWKLIYVARDKGPRAEFDISLTRINDETFPVVNGEVCPNYPLSQVYARFAELAECITKNILPPRDYQPEYDSEKLLSDPETTDKLRKKLEAGFIHRDWRCSFCPFLTKCLEDGDGSSNLF